MKLCAVICEYNPFHNGHKYLLDAVRQKSGCDGVLCIMSGNFTQRGDVAVLPKFTRARHAVENGADAVIELPAAFSVAPAQIFARGAMHILCSIPSVTTLAFGCEGGSAQEFLYAARATLIEDERFQKRFQEYMKSGISYAKAWTKTALSLHTWIHPDLLTKPNNLLGVEYCRAICANNSTIVPLPILRLGTGYSDDELHETYSSATAIRAALKLSLSPRQKKLLTGSLPPNILNDLYDAPQNLYEQAALCALLSKPLEEIALSTDCSEGLENKLTETAKTTLGFHEVLKKIVSKRYTLSRLKRILAQNLLGITRTKTWEYLAAPLYYKTLCVKKSRKEEILSALSKGEFPLIARKSDENNLKDSALSCFKTDERANSLFNILTGTMSNPHETLFV